MEMISEVTKGVYTLLEKMAEKEIERDPEGFIRQETLGGKEPGEDFKDKFPKKKDMKFSDSDEEFKDAKDVVMPLATRQSS
jgi:hypothetical protein